MHVSASYAEYSDLQGANGIHQNSHFDRSITNEAVKRHKFSSARQDKDVSVIWRTDRIDPPRHGIISNRDLQQLQLPPVAASLRPQSL
jgi:hypothetical protein